MRDRRGVEILPMDIICYPVRRGRKLEMHDARVQEVCDGYLLVSLVSDKATKVYALDRVTVLVADRPVVPTKGLPLPPEDLGETVVQQEERHAKHMWERWFR